MSGASKQINEVYPRIPSGDFVFHIAGKAIESKSKDFFFFFFLFFFFKKKREPKKSGFIFQEMSSYASLMQGFGFGRERQLIRDATRRRSRC